MGGSLGGQDAPAWTKSSVTPLVTIFSRLASIGPLEMPWHARGWNELSSCDNPHSEVPDGPNPIPASRDT